MVKWFLGSVALAALVLLAAAIAMDRLMAARLVLPAGEAEFLLDRGTSLKGLARQLAEEGLMQTPPAVFTLYGRLTGSQGFLQAGEYRLTAEMTSADALALFRSGRVMQRHITFVEGWTFDEWRKHLEQQPYLTQTLAGATNDAIMAQLGAPDLAAEGQFFPDTYTYIRGDSDFSIVQRAHRRMVNEFDQAWAQRDREGLRLSRYEALILASIVEKETGYPADRPLVASVFLNRLEAGMRLQSDPTVIYGIDAFDGNLKRSHLTTHTSFNTYVIRGLPPTPICNPGLSSILAVTRPEPAPYYYFVARGDGRSAFSVTLEEHNEAVARFQKDDRVENYRSAPPAESP